eukprot:SAG11_NODE_13795_length_639_cov_0.722222_1_plen_128_part_10
MVVHSPRPPYNDGAQHRCIMCLRRPAANGRAEGLYHACQRENVGLSGQNRSCPVALRDRYHAGGIATPRPNTGALGGGRGSGSAAAEALYVAAALRARWSVTARLPSPRSTRLQHSHAPRRAITQRSA